MEKCIIIAEAGVNHNGSCKLAIELIDAAADAGADYVKFQTFKADKLVSQHAPKATYQIANTPGTKDTQFEMLKKLELSEADHYKLSDHARMKGISFFSTAFDEEGLDFLEKLGSNLFKIPSGEITNLPYLKKIAGKRKPTILSTGMATLGEIESALSVLLTNGLERKDITVLHCTTEYPAPFAEVNLKAMVAIGQAFDVRIGYSDHTTGIEVPIAAVALGARCIEKHFTLSRAMEGPDHKASLEPGELTTMIKSIRNVEEAMAGNGVKIPTPSELRNRAISRKSIHLKNSLTAGHIICAEDLIMKRPGSGISPMELDSVLGRKLKYNLPSDSKLQYNQLD